MSRITKEDVLHQLGLLRIATGTPLERFYQPLVPRYQDPTIQCHNTGYLDADFNALYGGWQLTRVSNTSGAEQEGPLGFPERRLTTTCFYYMLRVAVGSYLAGAGRVG